MNGGEVNLSPLYRHFSNSIRISFLQFLHFINCTIKLIENFTINSFHILFVDCFTKNTHGACTNNYYQGGVGMESKYQILGTFHDCFPHGCKDI